MQTSLTNRYSKSLISFLVIAIYAQTILVSFAVPAFTENSDGTFTITCSIKKNKYPVKQLNEDNQSQIIDLCFVSLINQHFSSTLTSELNHRSPIYLFSSIIRTNNTLELLVQTKSNTQIRAPPIFI